MKTRVILILGFAAVACSESEPQIEVIESNATAETSIRIVEEIPAIYLKEEVKKENLLGMSLDDLGPYLDTAKSWRNEKNLEKNAGTYYIVFPKSLYITAKVAERRIIGFDDSTESLLKKSE